MCVSGVLVHFWVTLTLSFLNYHHWHQRMTVNEPTGPFLWGHWDYLPDCAGLISQRLAMQPSRRGGSVEAVVKLIQKHTAILVPRMSSSRTVCSPPAWRLLNKWAHACSVIFLSLGEVTPVLTGSTNLNSTVGCDSHQQPAIYWSGRATFTKSIITVAQQRK